MFGKNKKIEKEQLKFELKANEYLDNPHQTEGLMKTAIRKANEKKSSLGDSWGKLQLLVDLIRAWGNGEYRNVSKGTIASVIGAVIYFVSPIDLVPDFIAGLGIMDDAAVIAFTIKKISGELDRFKEWKDSTIPSIAKTTN